MIIPRLAKILVLVVIILIIGVMVDWEQWLIYLFPKKNNESVRFLNNNIKWGYVRKGSIDKRVMARGKLVLDATYPVIPNVKGQIKVISVKVGEPVKKGKTLATIEADTTFLDQVEEAIFNIKRLKIQISENRDKMKIERALLKEKLSSESRLKGINRILLLKESELSFWQKKLKRYALQANRIYDPDKQHTTDTYVKSPSSGIVLSSNGFPKLHTQSLIDKGMPLFVIGDLSQIYLQARISQIDLSSIRKGSPVIMKFDGIPDASYNGRISWIPLHSKQSPQMTIPYFDVSISFDKFDKRLKIGMTCDLIIIVERKEKTLLLDASAIYFKESPGVFVQSAESFAFRPVELGIESPKEVEILSGLAEGDTVVLNALEAVKILDQKDAR